MHYNFKYETFMNQYKSKRSLGFQLSTLQAVIINLKEAINLYAADDESLCDSIKQIMYSLRDIRYSLSRTNYKPTRASQSRIYSIQEIRALLSKYSKEEYLIESLRQIFYEENIKLEPVEQYLLNINPQKNNSDSSALIRIAEKYEILIHKGNLPLLTPNEYRIVYDRIKKQQDELF